jgi:hypothetical protein
MLGRAPIQGLAQCERGYSVNYEREWAHQGEPGTSDNSGPTAPTDGTEHLAG